MRSHITHFGWKNGLLYMIYEVKKLILPNTSSKPTTPDNGKCVYVFMFSGLPANSTKDDIRFFFENRRKSGGATIDDLMVLEDKVVITFATNDGKLMLGGFTTVSSCSVGLRR